jgi:hypothetical protein
MSSVKTLNSKAEVLGRGAALFMNINAAKGLYEVMKTNLGPKGTLKMLVGGAGGEPTDRPAPRLAAAAPPPACLPAAAAALAAAAPPQHRLTLLTPHPPSLPAAAQTSS